MVCGSGPDEKRNQLFFSDFQCISHSLKPPRVQITRHCPGLHIKNMLYRQQRAGRVSLRSVDGHSNATCSAPAFVLS